MDHFYYIAKIEKQKNTTPSELFQNPIEKSLKEAKSIPLKHISIKNKVNGEQIMQSISRSCTPSVDYAIHQQIMQSISRSCNPSADHAIHQQIMQCISRSCNPSADHAIHQ